MKRWLRLFLAPAETLWALPAVFAFAIILGGPAFAMPLLFLSIVCAALGLAIGLALDRRRWIGLFALPLAYMMIFALPLQSANEALVGIPATALPYFMLLPGVFMYMWCLRLAPLPLTRIFSAKRYFGGVIVAIVVYVVSFLTLNAPLLRLVELTTPFLLLFALFVANYGGVVNAARKRNASVPRGILGGNQVLIGGFSVIALLVLFWSQLRDLVAIGAQYVLAAIMWLILKLSELQGGGGGGGGGDGGSMLPDFGPADPTPVWLEVFTRILMVIALVAVIIVGAGFVGYVLFRLVRGLYRIIRKMIDNYNESLAAGYVDERSSILHIDETAREWGDAVRRAIARLTTRPPKWDAMTPSERIRFCYKVLLTRRTKQGDSSAFVATPRELIARTIADPAEADAFVEGYERARYAEQDIAAEPAEAAKAALAKIRVK